MFSKIPFRFGRRSNPLANLRNYTLFYDSPNDQALREICKHELAILEPHHYTSGLVSDLQAAGTAAIGYISVLETPQWNTERMSRLIDGDYLIDDSGARIHFPEWDSYLMDLSSPHYRELLVEEIRMHITDKGFDGILLDTVADLEDYARSDAARSEQLQAYLALLKRIKQTHPGISLIQNRGFSFIEQASPWIDGFLWENWDGRWQGSGWMIVNVKRMRKLRNKGLIILTLNTSDDAIHKREAEALGFLHLAKPQGYNAW